MSVDLRTIGPKAEKPLLHRLVDKDRSDVVRITDGYRITLKTSDPSKYPLPHPTLLLLHSMVSSVVAARGGADIFDNPYLDHSDDESLTLEELTAEENSEPDASSHWVHHRTGIHTCENLTPTQDDDWPPDILKSPRFEDAPRPVEAASPKSPAYEEDPRPVEEVLGEYDARELERWMIDNRRRGY